MVLQPDGDYKVEYSSRFTGRHTVEITHLGVAIMGSPFFVEIYDPSKIRVEGNRTGMVGKRMEFDVIRHLAGKAEMKLQITGPRGNNIRYDIYTIAKGEHVVYTPREPGIYKIDITYGGLDVPGCPIKQEITDNSLINAHGEGLKRAFEDQVATFYVDSRGQRGDLVVQVDGPKSMSKCTIDHEFGGQYKVTYTPVEVGVFDIYVRWNGQEIEGSPFHPRVVNPRKVMVVGGWESHLDAHNQMHLRMNETKTIEFNTSGAGQGQLSAELVGPGGNLPIDVIQREKDRYAVSFVPVLEGDYYLRIFWNGSLLEHCPILGVCHSSHLSNGGIGGQDLSKGTAVKRFTPQAAGRTDVIDGSSNYQREVKTTTSKTTAAANGAEHAYSLDKVVMNGMGLQQAIVNKKAEFIIDGTNAGEGGPRVTLTGVSGEVNVVCERIEGQKYRCTYVPKQQGIYSLHVSWADRDVSGSPYKVTVMPGGADAKKVLCVGESLQSGGVVGQELRTTIDTRKAGPGELTAQCVGPTRFDECNLIDNRNGTFTLIIKPMEAGKHILEVRYNNEHVHGSPFTLKIAGIPDPSKVRVTGPGIQDGYLDNFRSHFYVDTHGAGGGALEVTIRGPKAGFRVDMQRSNEKDRTIVCRYDPSEPGVYKICVRWSGVDVPGSPFRVNIMDRAEE